MRVERPNQPQTPSKEVTESKVIHDAHLLDSSGSMSGDKYLNALEGINSDIKAAKQSATDNPNIKSTFTIVEFDTKAEYHSLMKPIKEMNTFHSHCFRGMTALYITLGEAIEKLLSLKKKEDKVLLKIFTDGLDNWGGYHKYRNNNGRELALLIKKVQEEDNFTVTFVGTEGDVVRVVNNLNIDRTNALIHNNTAESVKHAYGQTVSMRSAYVNSVDKGEDVSKGFYSKSK